MMSSSIFNHPQVLFNEWITTYFEKSENDLDNLKLAREALERLLVDRRACRLTGNEIFEEALFFIKKTEKAAKEDQENLQKIISSFHTHFIKRKHEIIKLRATIFQKRKEYEYQKSQTTSHDHIEISAESLSLFEENLDNYICKCYFCSYKNS